ncbi:DUF192 domain-containing protein [Candidatus Synechococcus calcipolaris G9]|uniref:DUF192 domain-containing protein n=1 Tax=Candidatus Synechococcus calcipolaris G9 TaxID=1497997 RepID=A0ABT6EZ82_9SYNE|nr:DUF192 domain-containing protein [Candidatus Synechococcus calcipolaris]MDG2990884.1 DUF192 domain-containing protein [Candidatus Synechococcus calcipolaris G9]
MFSGKLKFKQVKQIYSFFLALGVALTVIGCQALEQPSLNSQNSNVAIAGVSQILPITAQAIIGETVIDLEVAKTPAQQALGLMYRSELADNRGMLFPFDPPQLVSFWMKNCLISLDLIFIYEGEVIDIAENAPPCYDDPCPTYGPNQIIDHVLELRGGRAAEISLAVGDRLKIKPLEQS